MAYYVISFLAILSAHLWLVAANDSRGGPVSERTAASYMPPVYLLMILTGQLFIGIAAWLPFGDHHRPMFGYLLRGLPSTIGTMMILWGTIKWTTM